MKDDLKAKLAATEGHTPSPWHYQHKRDNTPPDRGYAVLGGGVPGSIKEGIVAYCQRWISKRCPADEPNANLVALAPDLKAEVLRQDALIGELVGALEDISVWKCVRIEHAGEAPAIEYTDRGKPCMPCRAREALAKAREQS